MFFTTFLREKFWAIVLCLAVVYFLVLIRSDIDQNKRLDAEKRSISRNIAEQNQVSRQLKQKLANLNKGAYVGKIAREKLGLVERGESAYKVIIK